MEDDHTGDEELSSPMKVRELLALLKNVDPDFLIVIGADERSLMIVNPHPGFCQPPELEPDGVSHLTEKDRQFLRGLHIK
ncbi:MAG TPA: hypothetical protein VEV41_05565 [Terriglobales bacterium]|jgi:hypothetical protein|nr:hypothetical protein [Terriglobales bacterium]